MTLCRFRPQAPKETSENPREGLSPIDYEPANAA